MKGYTIERTEKYAMIYRWWSLANISWKEISCHQCPQSCILHRLYCENGRIRSIHCSTEDATKHDGLFMIFKEFPYNGKILLKRSGNKL